MTFDAALIEMTGKASDSFDIRASVRRCFHYDFDGHPARLWEGQGVLTTTTPVGAAIETPYGPVAGNEWLGTIDADGNNLHQVPAVRDSRDGASPRYTFTIPDIDADTYAAFKADQEIARGRDVTCYYALAKVGEGLLPKTPIRFAWRMKMRGVIFSESVREVGGSLQKVRSASVLARSLEYGRSRVPSGTMTDTAQTERARLLGLDSDSGCSFVAANSNRTYVVGG
tara:strand:- start:34122 stop:34802 length:681 start_codon:yes stop_codon:yes gene_type:complete